MATVYVPSPRGPTAHATVSVNRPGKSWNDVEAPAAGSGKAAAAAVPPMAKKTKVALAVAFVVLVVSPATAVAMIVGPGQAGSSGGSSSSKAPAAAPVVSRLPAGGATSNVADSSSQTPLTPEQTPEQAPATDAAQPVVEAVPVSAPTPAPAVGAAATLVVPDGQKLLWSDEFDGTSLDTGKWTFDTDATQGALSEGSLEVSGQQPQQAG